MKALGPTRFHWVRHGPTHAKALIGWTDLPADLGDTAALARLRAHLPYAPVISSDLLRAVQTADAIAETRPRLPHAPALREINFGAWEGLHHSAVPDQAHIRAYWDTPGDIAPPGGESWNALCSRINAAVDMLLAVHSGDLIVVAHFAVILTQVQRARGLTAYQTLGQPIDNLSVTEIFRHADWKAGRINHKP